MSEKPVCHLVWLQGRRAPDDVEDYYEVARPGDKCVDGSDAFPVFAEPRDKWIDVNDRLPGEQGHDSEEVSVFLNGHCGLLDYEKRKGGGWGYRTGYYDAERGCFRVHGRPEGFVTHWQPLPAAPSTANPTNPPALSE